MNEQNAHFSVSGSTLTVTVTGDIDHHNAKFVRDKIDARLYSERPKELVFDMSEVEFMDSSGLGLILGRYTKAQELGCETRIVNATGKTMKILDLAGIARLIKIS